jgi:hypothetical protein
LRSEGGNALKFTISDTGQGPPQNQPLPALTVLSLVAGYFLGLAPVVDTDTMVKSFGALAGIAAIAGFILTQRMKYQKRSLEYQKEISDHFYFRNVAGVLLEARRARPIGNLW